MEHTFVFDEETIWLLREATAAAARNAKTKAEKEKYIQLSEHVFLKTYLSTMTDDKNGGPRE